jgi:long-chain acyl-CoA synthetase
VLPSELEYIVVHAGATIVLAKDQEQVDKIIEIKGKIPGLKKIIYWEDKGIWDYDEPLLISFDEVKKLGREFEKSNQGLYEQMVKMGKQDDVAILSYTSGTTGLPRGVMLSHRNLLYYGKVLCRLKEPLEDSNYVAYLSPAWIWEQWAGLSAGLLFRMVVHFCEAPETVLHDIREIAPSFLMLGPRQWENLARTVQAKIKDTSWWKKMLYNWAMGIGYKVSGLIQGGKRPSWMYKAYYRLAGWVVLRALRDRLGVDGGKFYLTGSASMSPDIFRLFHAMGVHIRTLYATTEANVICGTGTQDFDFETVGTIFPDCDVKISQEREILVKGGQLFKGYYKDPETTAKRIDQDGWFHTGDAGVIDGKGRLIFWDRLDELMELAVGERFSPQYLETRLRFSPYIEDAFVIGDKEKGYVTAIISIDFINVAQWLESRNIPFTTFVDLSQKPEVCMLVKKETENINQNLPDFVKIKKFINLHKSFDADEGELTRTRKLRRAPMTLRYGEIIQAMYEGKKSFSISATVTYRDGRKGQISADLAINEV